MHAGSELTERYNVTGYKIPRMHYPQVNEAVRQRLLRVAVAASSIERVYSSYTDMPLPYDHVGISGTTGDLGTALAWLRPAALLQSSPPFGD